MSHADIQTWVATIAAKQSASTARKAHRVLSLILALAVRDGRLSRNPATDVRLPREVQKDRVYLTHAQVRALADAAAHPSESVVQRRLERGTGDSDAYGLAVLFLAYTGLRFGEMAALRVKRLDTTKRRAEIAESVTSVNGVLTWGTPKGHQRRWVSIPAFIVTELVEHIDGKRADQLVFESPLLRVTGSQGSDHRIRQ